MAAKPPFCVASRCCSCARSTMAINVALTHRTHYRYDRWVSLGPQTVRLRPAPHCRTPILSYSLKVRPENHFINWQQDPQSNFLARLVFPEQTKEFFVEVDLVAEMGVFNPFDFFLQPSAEQFPFSTMRRWRANCVPTSRPKRPGRDCPHSWLRMPRETMRTIDFLVGLNQLRERRDRVRDSHGAGRANVRGNAGPAKQVRAATRRGCWWR